MGFWDFMKRVATGQPVFDNSHSADQNDTQPSNSQNDQERDDKTSKYYSPRNDNQLPIDEHGKEIYPQLRIIQSGIHESGDDYLNLWVTIHNASDRILELENTDILGQNIRCCHRFIPNQQHQIEVYKGQVPKDDNYKKAILYYKEIHDGQYFNSVHFIQYRIEDSIRFLPANFKLLQTLKNQ